MASIAATASGFGAPFSDMNFEQARKEAGHSNKIVLVDFYTTWCGPCKMLDKNTWTDPQVIHLLEQKTVALRVDAEKETALSGRYKIQAYPSVLLIKPDGTEIDRLVGYRDPKGFMEDFNATLAGKDSLARAREQMEKSGTNNPSARMQYGAALAQKGKNAEALAEFLWCFDHGLENGPAFSGVRVSFLLNYIKNLGRHYPAAQQALETRRDDRQAKLMAGATDNQMVKDLISLNRTLGDDGINLAVFDKLPAGCPARHEVLKLCAEQFLKAGRYEDFLQGGDGRTAFAETTSRMERALDMQKNSPMREQMEATFRQMAITSGAQSFEALAGLKRDDDAKKLAGEILKYDSSADTRTVLADAAKRASNAELAQYIKP